MIENKNKVEEHLLEFRKSNQSHYLQDAVHSIEEWINSDRKGGARSNSRREITKFLFIIMKETEASIDPDYDRTPPPFSNLAPPPGTSLPSGVDPRAIKDDELREQYEADLAENEKKIEYFKQQHSLSNLSQSLQIKIVNYLTEEYAGHSKAQDEIEQIAKETGISREFLDLIRSKMK